MTRAKALVVIVGLLCAPSLTSAASMINWTFYGPGAGGRMQGGITASKGGPDGSNLIRTLDDVRMGKSKWVTLASATSQYGKWFCVGTVTYTSPMDRRTHTLENVVGYVHDTGCAFNGTCSKAWLPQFSTGQSRPDKMDVPIGNFTGWGAGPAMQFITRNPNKAASSWQQIAGLPTPGSTTGPCGGEPRETGPGQQATYNPTDVTDQAEQALLARNSAAPTGQPQRIGQPTQSALTQPAPAYGTSPLSTYPVSQIQPYATSDLGQTQQPTVQATSTSPVLDLLRALLSAGTTTGQNTGNGNSGDSVRVVVVASTTGTQTIVYGLSTSPEGGEQRTPAQQVISGQNTFTSQDLAYSAPKDGDSAIASVLTRIRDVLSAMLQFFISRR